MGSRVTVAKIQKAMKRAERLFGQHGRFAPTPEPIKLTQDKGFEILITDIFDNERLITGDRQLEKQIADFLMRIVEHDDQSYFNMFRFLIMGRLSRSLFSFSEQTFEEVRRRVQANDAEGNFTHSFFGSYLENLFTKHGVPEELKRPFFESDLLPYMGATPYVRRIEGAFYTRKTLDTEFSVADQLKEKLMEIAGGDNLFLWQCLATVAIVYLKVTDFVARATDLFRTTTELLTADDESLDYVTKEWRRGTDHSAIPRTLIHARLLNLAAALRYLKDDERFDALDKFHHDAWTGELQWLHLGWADTKFRRLGDEHKELILKSKLSDPFEFSMSYLVEIQRIARTLLPYL